MRNLTFLLLATLIAGCAHTAVVHQVPDASKLSASSRRLGQAVASARTAAVSVSAGLRAVRAQHTLEQAVVAKMEPQVDSLQRVAPPELQPVVRGMIQDVDDLKAAQAETTSTILQLSRDQLDLTGQLETATAAQHEVEKYGPEYQAAVVELTERANAAEQAWQKDSRELLELKTHSWLYRLGALLFLLLVIVIAFLWFTGRLAGLAARV